MCETVADDQTRKRNKKTLHLKQDTETSFHKHILIIITHHDDRPFRPVVSVSRFLPFCLLTGIETAVGGGGGEFTFL